MKTFVLIFAAFIGVQVEGLTRIDRSPTFGDAANVFGNLATGAIGAGQSALAGGAAAAGSAASGFEKLGGAFLGGPGSLFGVGLGQNQNNAAHPVPAAVAVNHPITVVGGNRPVRSPQLQDFANVFSNIATGAIGAGQSALAGGAAAAGSAASGFEKLGGAFLGGAGSLFGVGLGQNQINAAHPVPAAVQPATVVVNPAIPVAGGIRTVRSPQLQDFANVFGNLATGAIGAGQSALAGGAAAAGSAASGLEKIGGAFLGRAGSLFGVGLGQNQNNAAHPVPAAVQPAAVVVNPAIPVGGGIRSVRSPQLQDFANVFSNIATGAIGAGQSALAGGAAAAGSTASGLEKIGGAFLGGAGSLFGVGLGQNQNNAAHPVPAAVQPAAVVANHPITVVGGNRPVRSPQLQDFANVFSNIATGAIGAGQSALAGGAAAAGSAASGLEKIGGAFLGGAGSLFGVGLGQNQNNAAHPVPAAVQPAAVVVNPAIPVAGGIRTVRSPQLQDFANVFSNIATGAIGAGQSALAGGAAAAGSAASGLEKIGGAFLGGAGSLFGVGLGQNQNNAAHPVPAAVQPAAVVVNPAIPVAGGIRTVRSPQLQDFANVFSNIATGAIGAGQSALAGGAAAAGSAASGLEKIGGAFLGGAGSLFGVGLGQNQNNAAHPVPAAVQPAAVVVNPAIPVAGGIRTVRSPQLQDFANVFSNIATGAIGAGQSALAGGAAAAGSAASGLEKIGGAFLGGAGSLFGVGLGQNQNNAAHPVPAAVQPAAVVVNPAIPVAGGIRTVRSPQLQDFANVFSNIATGAIGAGQSALAGGAAAAGSAASGLEKIGGAFLGGAGSLFGVGLGQNQNNAAHPVPAAVQPAAVVVNPAIPVAGGIRTVRSPQLQDFANVFSNIATGAIGAGQSALAGGAAAAGSAASGLEKIGGAFLGGAGSLFGVGLGQNQNNAAHPVPAAVQPAAVVVNPAIPVGGGIRSVRSPQLQDFANVFSNIATGAIGAGQSALAGGAAAAGSAASGLEKIGGAFLGGAGSLFGVGLGQNQNNAAYPVPAAVQPAAVAANHPITVVGGNRPVRSPQLQDFANVFGNIATGAIGAGQSALAGGAAAAGSAASGFEKLGGAFLGGAGSMFEAGLGQNQNKAGLPGSAAGLAVKPEIPFHG